MKDFCLSRDSRKNIYVFCSNINTQYWNKYLHLWTFWRKAQNIIRVVNISTEYDSNDTGKNVNNNQW